MRVFKATYKDRNGRKRESAKWYAEIVDHDERPRRLPGFSDKQQTERLAGKLAKLVEAKLNKETPGRELSAWLETLPRRIREKLAAWGIIESQSVAASKPLADHVSDFEAALVAKGSSRRHAEQTAGRVRKLFDACGFVYWSNIAAATIQTKLADWRKPGENDKPGISIQTSNFYLANAKQFCRWMVANRRATESQLAHLQGQNVATDRRRERRALSADELRWLLTTTGKEPERFGMAGADRAILYRLAVESGLRSTELRSLTRASFDFKAEPATVTVAAGYSKRRRSDTLPLRPDTATLLRSHVATKLPAASVFAMPTRYDVAIMLREDMAAARNAWLADASGNAKLAAERERSDFLKPIDTAGQVADFHALRHTFISNLARGGVHPKLAQDLARHCDINLTMSRYSHTVLGEQSDALAALPDLSGPVGQQQRATGTDGRQVRTDHAERRTTQQPKAAETCLADCLAELDSIDSVCTRGIAATGEQAAANEKRNISRENRGFREKNKRTERDSNPRWTFAQAGFQDRCQDSTSNETPTGCDDSPNALGGLLGALGPELAAVVEAWPTLPEAVRAGIVAMVRASGK